MYRVVDLSSRSRIWPMDRYKRLHPSRTAWVIKYFIHLVTAYWILHFFKRSPNILWLWPYSLLHTELYWTHSELQWSDPNKLWHPQTMQDFPVTCKTNLQLARLCRNLQDGSVTCKIGSLLARLSCYFARLFRNFYDGKIVLKFARRSRNMQDYTATCKMAQQVARLFRNLQDYPKSYNCPETCKTISHKNDSQHVRSSHYKENHDANHSYCGGERCRVAH